MRSTEVSLVNYGLEVSLRGKPLPVQSKWNLLVGLNFALNRDVITKLPNEARQILNSDAWVANRLGGNTTSLLLYINKGVYATDEDVPVDPATGKRLRLGSSKTDEGYLMQVILFGWMLMEIMSLMIKTGWWRLTLVRN